jgi:hypothetical protein
MSRVTDLIASYKAGDITFEDLKDAFAVFRWAKPATFDAPRKLNDHEAYIDEHLLDDPTDTFDEVSLAWARRELTFEEYNDLAEVAGKG